MRKYLSSVVTALGIVTSFATTASAHIRLLDPPPRYEVEGETGIKSCPCGLGGSNRVCNVAQDGSDGDRSARVTRVEAGSTVTLRFEEFVDHAGRFRVAFDPEGADMADFNANILEDMSDPRGTGGQVWEIPVQVPDTTCDNCTLQLVQAMEVDVNTPIADPAPISSYYACVDLEIVARGTLGNDPGAQDPGAQDPGAQDPGAQDPGAQDPGAQDPGGEQAGAEPPNDGTDGDPDMGSQAPAQSSGAQSGSNSAGQGASTPLIPAGSGTPMDVGSSGSSAPTGAVAMNDVAAAAPGSIGGMLPPPPSLAGSSAESESSGGCGLAPGSTAPSGGVLGIGALGALAAILSRRSRRAR